MSTQNATPPTTAQAKGTRLLFEYESTRPTPKTAIANPSGTTAEKRPKRKSPYVQPVPIMPTHNKEKGAILLIGTA